MHTTFGLNNTQGLSTILTQNLDFHDHVYDSGVENLSIITSGPVPPNPAELLNSNRMKALVTQMQEEYDLVVLDVPPLLSVTDTQVLASSADGVILVVRQGAVQQAAVKRSVELLEMVHANLLGYVLNDVAPKNGYGYGYE